MLHSERASVKSMGSSRYVLFLEVSMVVLWLFSGFAGVGFDYESMDLFLFPIIKWFDTCRSNFAYNNLSKSKGTNFLFRARLIVGIRFQVLVHSWSRDFSQKPIK